MCRVHTREQERGVRGKDRGVAGWLEGVVFVAIEAQIHFKI